MAQKLRIIIMLRFGLVAFRFHFGKSENHSFACFWDFLTCPWLPWPILFNFGDTKILRIIQEKARSILEKYYFWNLNIVEIDILGNVGKGECPTKTHICLRCFRTSWIWAEYPQESMSVLEILNMGSISFINMEWNVGIEYGINICPRIWNGDFVIRDQSLSDKNMKLKFGNVGSTSPPKPLNDLWIFETLKLRNNVIETKKPRNQETSKLWNFETFMFSERRPPRHNIPTPTLAPSPFFSGKPSARSTFLLCNFQCELV